MKANVSHSPFSNLETFCIQIKMSIKSEVLNCEVIMIVQLYGMKHIILNTGHLKLTIWSNDVEAIFERHICISIVLEFFIENIVKDIAVVTPLRSVRKGLQLKNLSEFTRDRSTRKFKAQTGTCMCFECRNLLAMRQI